MSMAFTPFTSLAFMARSTVKKVDAVSKALGADTSPTITKPARNGHAAAVYGTSSMTFVAPTNELNWGNVTIELVLPLRHRIKSC